MQTILVAGGAGMAGASILQRLQDCCPDARLVATIHHSAPLVPSPRIEYRRADLTTRQGCQAATAGCDAAVLAAARGGGVGSAAQPHLQVTDNLVMDTLLLDACVEAGVKRLVYLSSATVYQEREGLVREDDLDLNQDPHPAYKGVGWAKRAAEKLCGFWREKYGLEAVVARCANIYGPFARFDPANSNFIPAIIRKAAEGMDPFEVWGSPEVRRDVIYAEDFAEAVARLLLARDIPGGVFNLGSGEPVSVGQVVDLALAAAGHVPSQIRYQSDRPTAISWRALDCTRLQNALGWRPAIGLAEGIRRTLVWWLANRGTWTR